VNVLSRIEAQAQPSGVCASRGFLDALTVRDVSFASLGQVSVKNFDHPMELYAWPPEHARAREATMTDPDDPNRPRPSGALPQIAALAADELTQMNSPLRPAAEPAEAEVTRALPAPSSNARPLSKSSGIFAVPSEEPFGDVATVAKRDSFSLDLPDPPSARSLQATRDQAESPDDESTAALRPGRSNQRVPRRSNSGSNDSLEVGVSPKRSRDPLIVVGLLGGAAVLISLITMAWILGRSARAHPATPPPPVAIQPPPQQPAAPPVAPAPQAAPPAPVAAQPASPPQAAPVPAAPAPVAESPRPTVAEEFAQAKARLRVEHMSARKKKALLGALNKLDHKVAHARSTRDKRRAEAALHGFMKKHKLL
jgi:hypothetical protein